MPATAAAVPGGPAPPAVLYAAPAGPTSLIQFRVEQEGSFASYMLLPLPSNSPHKRAPPPLATHTGPLGLDLGFVAAGQGGAPAGWRV